ncbi:MAG: AAA family ATPase [Actinobacteria bacterium]|nr:AAA family ATPase [Actinomycetota bacterium]
MEFRILGSMEVVDGDRRVELPSGRGRALLALLVLHAGEAVSAERLIDELWGERPPPTAATVVQGLVSKLRKVLEPSRGKGAPAMVLQTVGTGYRLSIDPSAIDADLFKRIIDAAHGAPAEDRSRMLAEALGLWRGQALADFAYEPFAQRAITALEDLRLAALEERIDADLETGGAGGLVGELERLVESHPFRERLRGLLMVALYRAGRQAEALEAYRRARKALVEELGIEPGPALRELEEAILRHDPALELQRAERNPVRATGWLPSERRTVTVVATDLTPSSRLDADAEAVGRLGARAVETATDVFTQHGGRVEHVLGDMLIAFFGFPVAHEDDAVRAVRAAVDLRTAIERLNAVPPTVAGARYAFRAGIDTGDIVVGGPGASLRDVVSGRVVSAAGRLQQAGGEGDMIVGGGTARLVRGAVVLKPAADIGDSWRVLDIVTGAPAVPRRLETPMFGRQQELTRIRSTFKRTARSGRPAMLTVVGEAGIGKTRLAKEFVSSIGPDATVITGRCVAYGEGITFLPLREVVLDAAGIEGWPALAEKLGRREGGAHAAAEIAATLGFGAEPGNVRALGPAVRLLLETLAADRPLVVVLEDVHWAEPALLDLVDYVTSEGAGAIFIILLARTELLEDRAPAGEALRLGPLSPEEIEELIVHRAGSMPQETLARIVETGSGNPLFAEQLLAAFEDGAVEAIPVTLHGLLATRLDRLGPGERDVLRCAAVVGTEPRREALEALLPEDAHPFVDRHIDALERRQLIAGAGESEFRFVHVLIQLAAYQSMTREDRAHLHERYADWLEQETSDPPPELDEIAGYHLEQAFGHRRATGAPDAGIAMRAVDHLSSAGHRALARIDWGAAENLMSRARALLPAEDSRRLALTQSLAETNLVLGRFADAQAMLRDVARTAGAAGDHAAEWAARLEHARIQFIVGPDPVPLGNVRSEAEQAAAYYESAGDDGGRGRALFLFGCVRQREGKMRAAESAFRESMTFADRATNVRERMATRWMLSEVLLYGPVPAATCIEEGVAIIEQLGWDHPGILTHRAVLEAMQCRFDEARAINERARQIFLTEMHAPRMLMFVSESQAAVEQLAGDHVAAERELRTRLAFARENGEPYYVAQTAARLALVVWALGRTEEAAALARLSADAAPAEGAVEQALSRAALAVVSADGAEAVRLAREAVDVSAEELPNLSAELLEVLAEILRGNGDAPAATVALDEAHRLYEIKGNVAAARRLEHPELHGD